MTCCSVGRISGLPPTVISIMLFPTAHLGGLLVVTMPACVLPGLTPVIVKGWFAPIGGVACPIGIIVAMAGFKMVTSKIMLQSSKELTTVKVKVPPTLGMLTLPGMMTFWL